MSPGPWRCGRFARNAARTETACSTPSAVASRESRPSAEAATLLDLLHRQVRRFEKPGADPWALAADDPKKPPHVPAGATPAQLAAWTAVARVLLNLDETITKE